MLGARPPAGTTWATEFGGVGAHSDSAAATASDQAATLEARFCAYALQYLRRRLEKEDRRVFVSVPPPVVAAMPERCLATGFLGDDLAVLLEMARRGGLPQPERVVWRLSKRLSALYLRLAFGTRTMIGASRFACAPDEFSERARRACDLFKRKGSASLALLAKKPVKAADATPSDAKKKKKKPPPRSTALKMDDDPLAPGKCEWSRQAKENALTVACETLCRDASLAAARLECPISQPYCAMAEDHAGDGGHVCTKEWVMQTE